MRKSMSLLAAAGLEMIILDDNKEEITTAKKEIREKRQRQFATLTAVSEVYAVFNGCAPLQDSWRKAQKNCQGDALSECFVLRTWGAHPGFQGLETSEISLKSGILAFRPTLGFGSPRDEAPLQRTGAWPAVTILDSRGTNLPLDSQAEMILIPEEVGLFFQRLVTDHGASFLHHHGFDFRRHLVIKTSQELKSDPGGSRVGYWLGSVHQEPPQSQNDATSQFLLWSIKRKSPRNKLTSTSVFSIGRTCSVSFCNFLSQNCVLLSLNLTMASFSSRSLPSGIDLMFFGMYQKHTLMNGGCNETRLGQVFFLTWEALLVLCTFLVPKNWEKIWNCDPDSSLEIVKVLSVVTYVFHDEFEPISLRDFLLQIPRQVYQSVYLLLKPHVALQSNEAFHNSNWFGLRFSKGLPRWSGQAQKWNTRRRVNINMQCILRNRDRAWAVKVVRCSFRDYAFYSGLLRKRTDEPLPSTATRAWRRRCDARTVSPCLRCRS